MPNNDAEKTGRPQAVIVGGENPSVPASPVVVKKIQLDSGGSGGNSKNDQ